MPRQSKGPRLWLQPARKDGKGKVVEQAVWVIREGATKRSTGCGPGEIEQATAALRDYLNAKPTERPRDRDPSSVAIADVVAIYTEDVVSKHVRPKETAARLNRILDFFGDKMLSFLNKKTCTDYAKQRGSEAAARRELEDLRAAVRHHWEAGLCVALTPGESSRFNPGGTCSSSRSLIAMTAASESANWRRIMRLNNVQDRS